MDRFFNDVDETQWQKSRFLCVNDNPLDGACRALEYCRWDVQEACNLIEQNLDWRNRGGIDSILYDRLPLDHVQAIRLAFGDGFYGFDLEGFPCYWCPAGMIDIASLKDRVPLDEMVRYHIQMMEFNQQVYLRRISSNSNRTLHNFTGILDLKGFGVRNLNKAFRECLSVVSIVDRDYYYDNFHRVIIMNAPTVFRLFWRTTSALYRAETKAKFIFLDKPSDLAKYVSPDITPERFGGTYTENDAIFTKDNLETQHSREMDAYMDEISRKE
jgi:hypothetical protein